MNFVIFLLSYFVVITSLVGYGLVFQNFFNKRLNLEFEFSLLGSVLFWILLSLITHFFFNHGYIHNGIIILIGLISFSVLSYKNNKFKKNYLKYLLLIFILMIFGVLGAKTHDDFPYYHFPYTFYLTQENLIVGTGILNHGFRTPSSIFYLNSIFYLPLIKYYSFNFGAAILFGISNLILILKLKTDYNNKKFDYIFYLTLLSFLFINIFFYRIAEHGTDRSAQILIFLLIIEILSISRNKVISQNFFSKIFILLGLIISLKAFYVLYLLILIPIIFFVKRQKKKTINEVFKNFYFYFFFLIGLSLIFVNIFNTGCILYPIEFSCLKNFDWSLNDQAKQMSNWYEQWSKAGAGPNYRINDPENYIKGFNWVGNWIDRYFFNKVSDFLLGIIFLIAVVYFTFYSKNSKKMNINKENNLVYLIIIILFFEWFYNHPSLRYGGFTLIALVFFIPVSIYMSRFLKQKNIKKKLVTLIACSLIIFVGRNVQRINHEIKKYNYDFMKNPYYLINDNHFRVETVMKKMRSNFQNCKNRDLEICRLSNGIFIEKKNNYFFLKRKK